MYYGKVIGDVGDYARNIDGDNVGNYYSCVIAVDNDDDMDHDDFDCLLLVTLLTSCFWSCILVIICAFKNFGNNGRRIGDFRSVDLSFLRCVTSVGKGTLITSKTLRQT